MGGTAWSADEYTARASYKAANSIPTFDYHDKVSRGVVAKVAHKSLDPKGLKVRESRDSDTHPTTKAVAVVFDVTGSMASVPKTMQEKLPKLMGLLTRKGYLEHPAILMGAIGDAYCDSVPLQVGQFESGLEIENDLTNIFLEGGGGGQQTESYELAMYTIARHTSIDCFEKRGEKGYLFLIGDEMAYPKVSLSQIESLLGFDGPKGRPQSDIPLRDIVAELQERWEVFYILPNMTSYYNDHRVIDFWTDLFGDHFLRLQDPAAVCELIASAIGMAEGKVDVDGVDTDLEEAGTDAKARGAVTTALAKVGAGTLAKPSGTAIAVPSSGAGSGVATL